MERTLERLPEVWGRAKTNEDLLMSDFFKKIFSRPAVCYGKEAGEVSFIGFYPFGQYFHLVDLGGQFPANSSVSFQVILGNPSGTHRRIFFLNHLGIRQGIEEVGTLHKRNRVGVDFRDIVYRCSRQCNKRVRNAQFVFADHSQSAFANQFMILQQAPCNSILDGHQSQQRRVFLDG